MGVAAPIAAQWMEAVAAQEHVPAQAVAQALEALEAGARKEATGNCIESRTVSAGWRTTTPNCPSSLATSCGFNAATPAVGLMVALSAPARRAPSLVEEVPAVAAPRARLALPVGSRRLCWPRRTQRAPCPMAAPLLLKPTAVRPRNCPAAHKTPLAPQAARPLPPRLPLRPRLPPPQRHRPQGRAASCARATRRCTARGTRLLVDRSGQARRWGGPNPRGAWAVPAEVVEHPAQRAGVQRCRVPVMRVAMRRWRAAPCVLHHWRPLHSGATKQGGPPRWCRLPPRRIWRTAGMCTLMAQAAATESRHPVPEPPRPSVMARRALAATGKTSTREMARSTGSPCKALRCSTTRGRRKRRWKTTART